jgi:hypothetical protein
MTPRVLCLLAGLSVASPLFAGDPSGEHCPFGPTDPQLHFDTVQEPLELVKMDPDPASGPLPCGYAAVIDDGNLPRVGVDVAAIPRHLAVTVALDAQDLTSWTTPDEGVKVLEVQSPPADGEVVGSSAAVWYHSNRKLELVWRRGGETLMATRDVPAPQFRLVLSVDRGRPDDDGHKRGHIRVSFPETEIEPIQLAPVDVESFPIAGLPAATVRFGVLATLPAEMSGKWRGRLRFRPIAIETGWGRP